ncbi:hypothetical protein J2741_001789 [Methanolinea mesophila]|uniref:hypothetical protein n=1 Tax=Methanolinea mesophila TaxID=547055 RepID=UPI001AE66139|nr:hypothetical protein [Methanolinea mesophila]MBP1929242.1 hypothetical protein [Methanolinea mesophila]
MTNDPSGSLKALIEKYTVISFIPDIDHYRRIVVPKRGSCIFRGCREPIAWEDARGKNFLCENHFRVMQQWILEARKGLIPGGQSESFRVLEDFVNRTEPEPGDLFPGEVKD